MFIYDLSFFLTSTAFVPTNAKYGIPLSRYTLFFENCPLGDAPILPLLFNYVSRDDQKIRAGRRNTVRFRLA